MNGNVPFDVRPPHFNVAVVIGVGLLGGSLGLALKANQIADNVLGVGHRRSSLNEALDNGAIDEGFLDPADALPGADLVVVCTPAGLVIPMLDTIRALAPMALVTDVASTKAVICRHAQQTWPSPRRFIGSHPMAGSEKFGAEHAFLGLYDNQVVLVEQGKDLDREAREQVCALWRAVGSTVVDIDPEQHDLLLARTSHLPHVLASCLASVAAQAETDPETLQAVTGRGFRDTTRIAASRPEIWRDICLTNRDAMITVLDDTLTALHAMREALHREDAQRVETFFEAGCTARGKMVR